MASGCAARLSLIKPCDQSRGPFGRLTLTRADGIVWAALVLEGLTAYEERQLEALEVSLGRSLTSWQFSLTSYLSTLFCYGSKTTCGPKRRHAWLSKLAYF